MNFLFFLVTMMFISHILNKSWLAIIGQKFNFLHQYCIQHAPKSVTELEALTALVCAKDLDTGSTSELLVAAGLIHVFVVSGSHLSVIKKMITNTLVGLRLIRLPKIMNFRISSDFEFIILSCFLFLYCAVCNFNAPIMRSFFQFLFTYLFKSIGRKTSPSNLVLFSSLICLIMHFKWMISLSFQMSWIAALSIVLINQHYKKSSPVTQNIIFYLQFLLCFNFMGIPPIVAALISAFFTPFLEKFLFPFALMVYFISTLGFIFDSIIQNLFILLELFELEISSQIFNLKKLVLINWIFIILMHLYLHITEIYKKRAQV